MPTMKVFLERCINPDTLTATIAAMSTDPPKVTVISDKGALLCAIGHHELMAASQLHRPVRLVIVTTDELPDEVAHFLTSAFLNQPWWPADVVGNPLMSVDVETVEGDERQWMGA